MLSHTLWQRQIVVATKLAVRHGGRIWWSRVLKSRGLRAAVRSLDFYVYKERAPGAEGGREQLCSLSRANQRPRICELKYPGSLFCHGGTGPGAGNAGDGPGCLFRHTQSFIWATKCPFRATFTPQGSSLGRISCPETAHHMKASRKKASTKSPRVRSPGPRAQSHPAAVPPCHCGCYQLRVSSAHAARHQCASSCKHVDHASFPVTTVPQEAQGDWAMPRGYHFIPLGAPHHS